ncbi:methyltransferase-like protein 4 [Mucor ambiguus]|uniref:Methyltransferase-like protein 4 n=1 Tax=Mucor ambiguus TaxID=91626 RepID=A0A0C9LRY6_9FUNG|nr:methyltransferase-like protein 4 [Mucor ambiguus]
MFDIIDSEKGFSKGITPYRLIQGEFDVCQPYFRAKKEEKLDAPVAKKRRKNKPKNPSNADVDTQKRHQELRPQLIACLEQLPEKWPAEWKARITPTIIASSVDNEAQAVDFPSIQQMVETAQDKFSFNTSLDADNERHVPEFELKLPITTEIDIFSIFNTVYINRSLTDVKLLQFTPSATYLIPPKSSFLMGSMQNSLDQLGAHISKLGGADLIVMDPPWPNKSVQRSSHYETQDIYDLYSIPIQPMIANKDTIIAVWVTNKPKFRNFIINKLFPSWKLECISEWVWLKMTTQGECIFPVDSEHKKPYEQLIIGRPIASSDMSNRISMPESHVIVSMPSTRHSRKPPLHDILNAYLNKKDPVCVEMFSRCLYPGWVSWGNECLKFQHLSFFDKDSVKESK